MINNWKQILATVGLMAVISQPAGADPMRLSAGFMTGATTEGTVGILSRIMHLKVGGSYAAMADEKLSRVRLSGSYRIALDKQTHLGVGGATFFNFYTSDTTKNTTYTVAAMVSIQHHLTPHVMLDMEWYPLTFGSVYNDTTSISHGGLFGMGKMGINIML